MRAIVIHRTGGPEVLEQCEIEMPEPSTDEIRVGLKAVGINRRDALIRGGVYKRDMPLIPGIEGAGIIDAVGPGVTNWRLGQRVVYYVPDLLGAYAEAHVVPVDRVVEIPDDLSFEQAVSVFDHGLTAHYLTSSTFPLQSGHRVLVQAAAGGVGSLIVQMAKRRGATVFGAVSSPEKAQVVQELGADRAILYRDEDVPAAIAELTGGQGVHVVYDSTGRETIKGSISSLSRRGMLVLYGQSSGPVDVISPAELADRGSLFFTRPHLIDHITPWEQLNQRSSEIFDWVLGGQLKVAVGGRYSFSAVQEAHSRLENRALWGKLILFP